MTDSEAKLLVAIAALKSAEKTYAALERNKAPLLQLLQNAGLPSSWLVLEINKADKIRAAIKSAEQT